jgi:hypothetical protein
MSNIEKSIICPGCRQDHYDPFGGDAKSGGVACDCGVIFLFKKEVQVNYIITEQRQVPA